MQSMEKLNSKIIVWLSCSPVTKEAARMLGFDWTVATVSIQHYQLRGEGRHNKRNFQTLLLPTRLPTTCPAGTTVAKIKKKEKQNNLVFYLWHCFPQGSGPVPVRTLWLTLRFLLIRESCCIRMPRRLVLHRKHLPNTCGPQTPLKLRI